MSGRNPFERFDLDPREGPAAITRRLRELLEDAPPSEHEAIRRAWEELTRDPRRRIEAALGAHPESRPGLGAPPQPPSTPPPPLAPTLADLVPLPSVARVLGSAPVPVRPPRSLDDDPILKTSEDLHVR